MDAEVSVSMAAPESMPERARIQEGWNIVITLFDLPSILSRT